MAKPRVRTGQPTQVVALNLKRLRAERGLSVRALSERTREVSEGRGMTANAVSEVENGQRRVDVDDLIYLSLALDVAPVALLMPTSRGSGDGGGAVELIIEGDPMYELDVWAWLTAAAPLPVLDEVSGEPVSIDSVDREAWRRRFVPRFAWKKEGSDG
ncbi:MAG: helix-turn-helix transcriptional regulator [Gordonia amarae]